MPPAIIPAVIAGVVGIGSMINSNVQQKAAIKNNETQQASAVANAKDATSNAQKQIATYTAANPAPLQAPTQAPVANYGGAAPGKPPAPGAGGTTLPPAVLNDPNVKAIMNSATTGASTPSAAVMTPMGGAGTTSGNSTANLISRILGTAAA